MPKSLSRSGKAALDIIKQDHIQETLRYREAQLELALEFARIGTWDWDIATNQVIWNANHFSLLGLEANGVEATYDLWRDRVHPDDLQRVEKALTDALENHTAYETEYRIIYPDGTRRWLTGKGRGLYDSSGRALRMMGVLIDVSDRKQTEAEICQLNQTLEKQNCSLEQAVEQRTAELRQLNEKLQAEISERQRAENDLTKRTVQLEETNRELESFSYSVSHDLRAPLRHINGFVVALSRQLSDTEAARDSKVQHYLRVIQDSGKRMGLLVDGLLTLSRVGRRQMESRSVDLTELADRSVRLIKIGLGAHASVQFSLEKLPVVQGDPILLEQVFTNLIDNAVKFSQGRSPAQIAIGTLPNGTLFVKDNGVGFQMQYADQLFGAFQRLHSQREFEGMGIGLAIVQRVVHRHAGTIWAESQPGQGACFYFTLR